MNDTRAGAHVGRNLLFGILAMQNSFINRDALLAAFNSWVEDKSRSLGEILVAQAALLTARLSLLEALVQEHLRQHGGDTERSLAAVGSIGSLRGDLDSIADPDLLASVSHVSTGRGGDEDPDATAAYSSSASGSAGDRFRLIRYHAKGGLGEVYIASDEELHREVALKRIQAPYVDDPDSRSRFLLEAEVTGGLEHPGIVPVYGLGSYDGGRPFYVMRFIKGDSLREAIAGFHQVDQAPGRDPGERSLTLRKLLGRFVDVCNAVAYAHSRGVLHRDLKPGNVMLGPYGETLVVDWGLAKVVGRPDVSPLGRAAEPTLRPPSSSGVAPTQAAVGTPQYMSPEQAAADADRLGPRSDVYSLGAMLYTLLTGRAPIAKDELHIMLGRVQRGEFPPPRQVKREVPAALQAICLKAMSLRPEDRYPTPRALAEDIEHWLADEPVSASPESRWQRSARWLRRHRTLARSLAAASLLVVLTSVTALFFVNGVRERERAERLKAGEESGKAVRAERAENEQRLVAEDNLYLNNIALANRESSLGNYVRVNQLLEQCPPRLRGWEWHYLDKLCKGDLVTFQGHAGPVMAADFSPDGTRVVSAGDDGTVRIWDAATGREGLVLKGHTKGLLGVKYSPDGRQIASAGRDATVRIWDAATGREVRTLKGHVLGVAAVSYSPDGRLLASAGWDRTVKLWDAATGREVRSFNDSIGAVIGVSFSPDGASIAITSVFHDPSLKQPGRSEVVVREVATGKPFLSVYKDAHDFPDAVSSVAFIPGGRLLVGGMRGGIFDATTGASSPGYQLRGRTTVACDDDGRHFASSRGIVFLPGDAITFVGSPGLVTISDPTNVQDDVTLLGHNDSITHVTFSHDGRRLVSASLDGTVKVWRVTTDREADTLTGHPAGLSEMKYGDDGRRLATAGGGQVRVWDLAAGRALLAVRGRDGFDFSSDGARLAVVEDDHDLIVRDASDGRAVHAIHESAGILSLTFSPNGQRLAALVGAKPDISILKERAGKVKVWEMAGGRLVQSFAIGVRSFSGIQFSHDSRLLAFSHGDSLQTEEPGQVVIWEVSSGRLLFTRRAHPGGIYTLAFSPDDKRLVTAGRDAVATVWDIEAARELLSLRGHSKHIVRVVFGPDGRTIASRSRDETVRLWDARTGHQILILRGFSFNNHGGFLAYSPDGKRLISDGQQTLSNPQRDEIVLWDSASGQELLTLRGSSGRTVDAASNSGGSLTVNAAFSPDGTRLISASSDGGVKVWDVSPARPQDEPVSGRGSAGLSSPAPAHGQASGRGSRTIWGHENAVNGVAFSPTGDRIVSASTDGTVRIWDAATSRQVRVLRGHRGKVHAVAFSRDGTRIASGGDDATKIWDAETGRVRLTVRGHTGAVSCVSFDPEGMAIVTGGADATVRVWDATSGREVYRLAHSQLVKGVALSEDGTRVAAAGGNPGVKVWDLTTGQEDRVLVDTTPNPSRLPPVAGVKFSREGKRVASANARDAVMIWDFGDGRLSRTLTGHGGRVTDLEFSPGGRQIASACEDGTVRIWQIETGKEVRALKGHTNTVTGLSYSPDGKRLASSSLDGTIEIWEVTPDSAAPRIAEDAGRRTEPASPYDLVRRGLVRYQFGHCEDAERDFTVTIERGLNPGDPYLFMRRGETRARLGRWAEADADFVEAIDRKADFFSWFAHALMRLQLDDIDGYRKTCERILDHFGKSEDAAIAHAIADTCALAPQAVPDLARPVQFAERAVTRLGRDEGTLQVLGLCLYRAGRFEEAIGRLDEAAQMSRDSRGSLWNWLVRAMAHHNLGHAEEAMKWLEQAVQRLDREIPKDRREPTSSVFTWNQQLALQQFRREAEALINESRSLYLPPDVFADRQPPVRPASK